MPKYDVSAPVWASASNTVEATDLAALMEMIMDGTVDLSPSLCHQCASSRFGEPGLEVNDTDYDQITVYCDGELLVDGCAEENARRDAAIAATAAAMPSEPDDSCGCLDLIDAIAAEVDANNEHQPYVKNVIFAVLLGLKERIEAQ